MQSWKKKVKELLADAQVEESRIAAEVILFADKICTDEEIVRLKSHIDHMKSTLQAGEASDVNWTYRSGDEPGGQYDSVKGQ